MRKFLLYVFATFAISAGSFASHAQQEKVSLKSSAELIQLLQQGGFVVYMPHGNVNRNFLFTSRHNDPLTCDGPSSLSDKSQQEMTAVGKTIAQLQLPISTVQASPYCQTRETAQAVFGQYNIDPELAYSKKKTLSQSSNMGQYLKQAMLNSDTEQGNTIFVGHSANLIDGFGIWPKPAGVAVVFKKSADDMILLGMIKPNDWNEYNQ